ncbi:TetR/AcrR family transcriptional regulator (plasmid) [Acinetobacter sp. SK-43]|uniref:TetR/AcrR family transcriptional regulator n=1 Tax=Acinetobacter sp. SK-43 TaxID=2785295 RepID=UPI00188C6ABF|nr:TetR/AcrR family transcriptional regulator [Acinetobacter sp. SK-43]MBF4454024.1 TetR/AcrR family transcriptional regulator [Acinetobacter sp. SK-43]
MTTFFTHKGKDILNTAIRLYYAHGFNSVGIDRIILESKVAKMTYYKYYPAKVNLYEACLNHEIKVIETDLMSSINVLSEDDYVGRIKNLFSWFYTITHIPSYNGMLYQKAKAELSNASCLEIIDNYYNWLDQLIFELLSKANVSQPNSKTRVSIAFIDGMVQTPNRLSYVDLNVFLNTFIFHL